MVFFIFVKYVQICKLALGNLTVILYKHIFICSTVPKRF